MQRLLLHIGLTKTGSSALQVFFAQNREAMLTHSVDYLQIGGYNLGAEGRISSGNGGKLARNLAGKNGENAAPDILAAREELLQALADSPCAIGLVSSEALSSTRPDKLAPLLQEIAAMGIRVEVVYFIREQEQALCSGYMQQVKRHGCTEAPEAHIAAAYVAPGSKLKYNALYDQMLKLYDASAIHCLVYEDARNGPNGLFGAFMQAAGLPKDGLDFTARDINNSLHPNEIGIMLVLNRYKPRTAFSDAVVENSRDAGRTRSGSTHRLISATLSRTIRAHFEADNAAFARRYFNRETLFPLRPIEEGEGIDVDTIHSDMLAEVVGGLLVKYDQRLAVLERRISQLGGKAKPGGMGLGRGRPGQDEEEAAQ